MNSKVDAVNELDISLTVAAVMLYCESENTAAQAIEEIRKEVYDDGTFESEAGTILFCIKLLQTKKMTKDKQDQIAACNEIIACAQRIKDIDFKGQSKTSIVETKPIKGDVN